MSNALSRGEAIKLLVEKYKLEEKRARRILEIAQEFGRKSTPCAGGFVHVVYRGSSDTWPYTERFTVHDHTQSIAKPSQARYTSTTALSHSHDKMEKIMPPARRTRAARPAPEPEPEIAEPDVTKYLEKAFSPTMQDYIEWAEDNIGPLDDLSSDRLLVLGSQLYPKFAASEMNITRREARKAQRASSNGDEEVEEAPARPVRARRGAAAAAAKPARARRAAEPVEEEEEEAPAPARPAGRRSRKPAAAAPY